MPSTGPLMDNMGTPHRFNSKVTNNSAAVIHGSGRILTKQQHAVLMTIPNVNIVAVYVSSQLQSRLVTTFLHFVSAVMTVVVTVLRT